MLFPEIEGKAVIEAVCAPIVVALALMFFVGTYATASRYSLLSEISLTIALAMQLGLVAGRRVSANPELNTLTAAIIYTLVVFVPDLVLGWWDPGSRPPWWRILVFCILPVLVSVITGKLVFAARSKHQSKLLSIRKMPQSPLAAD